MSILSILLFLLSPILSLPVAVLGFFKDKKHRLVYLGIFAAFLALFAYNFVPTQQDDLFRLQLEAKNLGGVSLPDLPQVLIKNTEQLSLLFKFLIGKIGDLNLLQLSMTWLSYFIMFWLINDILKRTPVGKFKSLVITSFTIMSFSYLTVATNIFCNLALEILSLGVYLDYVAKVKKPIPILLYIISVLIHSSLIMAIVPILCFKLARNKLNLIAVATLVGVILSISFILPMLAENFDLPLIKEATSFYKAYFENDSDFRGLHSTPLLILYLSKMTIYPIAFFINGKKRSEIDNVAMLFFIMIVVLFPQTTFAIRFIPILQLCGLPMLAESANGVNGNIIVFLTLVLLAPQTAFQIWQISRRNFGNPVLVLTNGVIMKVLGG